nr:hypothetical protein [Tanacetum cinerariifolium]
MVNNNIDLNNLVELSKERVDKIASTYLSEVGHNGLNENEHIRLDGFAELFEEMVDDSSGIEKDSDCVMVLDDDCKETESRVDEFQRLCKWGEVVLVYEFHDCVKGGGENVLEMVEDKLVSKNDESLSFNKELDIKREAVTGIANGFDVCNNEDTGGKVATCYIQLWKYEKHKESLVRSGKEYDGEHDGSKENESKQST